MPKQKKEYLVIGSNNFWYASCLETLKEAKEIANDVIENSNGYSDPESGHEPEEPETVYIYKAYEIARVENNNFDDEN